MIGYPTEEVLDIIKDNSVYLSYGCFEGNVARLSETYELLMSYGVTDIATDILSGAHDWGTWHAAFENFVEFINWG